MRVIQAQVFASGNVGVWGQSDDGERVYFTVHDQAFTEGLLDALLPALERAVRSGQPRPGRSAIHGRPPASEA